MDELVFDMEMEDFHLFPKDKNGLSDDAQPYQVPMIHPKVSLIAMGFGLIHALVVAEKSPFGKYFKWRSPHLLYFD